MCHSAGSSLAWCTPAPPHTIGNTRLIDKHVRWKQPAEGSEVPVGPQNEERREAGVRLVHQQQHAEGWVCLELLYYSVSPTRWRHRDVITWLQAR